MISTLSALPFSRTSAPTRRLLIVEDHPLVRTGLKDMLKNFTDVEICGEAQNAGEALGAMKDLKPEVVLLDISLPGGDGISLIQQLLLADPDVRILVLSMHDEAQYALKALLAGAKGYLMKDEALNTLLEALRTILDGGVFLSAELRKRRIFQALQSGEKDFGGVVARLSPRELQVLTGFGRGAATQDLAAELQMSVKTVETHRAHIKGKLGFREIDELLRFAREWTEVTKNTVSPSLSHK